VHVDDLGIAESQEPTVQEPRAVPVSRSQVDLPLLAQRVSALLEAGVPLTLLIDLSEPTGPRSHDMYASEIADMEWLTATV
jgi:hypothetical protein